MKVAVFGSTGPTGLQVVEQALAQGHVVTAVARTPAKLALTHECLNVVRGDVLDLASIEAAVTGQEAVLSAVGASGRAPTTVYSEGTRHIMAAMHKAGVQRLVAVTSGLTRPTSDAGFIARVIVHRLLRNIYDDMARMEGLVMASNLDWTIVRPAALREGPKRGAYRVEETMAMPGGTQIRRADLAAFMLKELSERRYIRKAVAIAY